MTASCRSRSSAAAGEGNETGVDLRSDGGTDSDALPRGRCKASTLRGGTDPGTDPGTGAVTDTDAGTDTVAACISGAVTDVEDGSTSGRGGAAGTDTSDPGNPPGPGMVLMPSLAGGREERTETSLRIGMLS